MDEKQFQVLTSKLDSIIALLAGQRIADKPKTEAILDLHQLGLDKHTIAHLVGTSPNAVAVRISEAKKKGAQ